MKTELPGFDPLLHCEGCRCKDIVALAVEFTDDGVGFCPRCWREYQDSRRAENIACHINAIGELANERQRQIEEEDWTPAHDDEHYNGQMGAAAAAYALTKAEWCHKPAFWPWAAEWWKPKDYRRNLVRAGALIIAELERLDRYAAQKEEVKK